MAGALAPGRVQVGLEPGRGGHGETVQGVAHSLADEFQAIERPDGGQDMRGIGAVRATGLQKIVGLQVLQQRLEEQVRRPPWTSRVRNSLSTEASNPGSVRSKASAYFQSIRPRTASAACRSDKFSTHWSISTSASRA